MAGDDENRQVYYDDWRIGTGYFARFWDFMSLVAKSYSRQIKRLPWKPLFFFALGCGCAMAMFALIQNARSRRNQYPFMIKGMKLNQGHPFMVDVHPVPGSPMDGSHGGDGGPSARQESAESSGSEGGSSKKQRSPRSKGRG